MAPKEVLVIHCSLAVSCRNGSSGHCIKTSKPREWDCPVHRSSHNKTFTHRSVLKLITDYRSISHIRRGSMLETHCRQSSLGSYHNSWLPVPPLFKTLCLWTGAADPPPCSWVVEFKRHHRIHITPSHEQDTIEDQFLHGVLKVWVYSFFFSKTGCHTMTKEFSLPYYLLITEVRIVGFVTVLKSIALGKQPSPGFELGSPCLFPLCASLVYMVKLNPYYSTPCEFFKRMWTTVIFLESPSHVYVYDLSNAVVWIVLIFLQISNSLNLFFSIYV